MNKFPDMNIRMYEILMAAKKEGLSYDVLEIIYDALKDTKTFRLTKYQKRYNITEL